MKDSLAKNALYNGIYRLLNAAFPLISAAYAARVLLPAGVGRVAWAQNMASWFLVIAACGLPQYATREIARSREEPREVSRLAGEFLAINFLSTTACILAYGCFLPLVAEETRGLCLVFGLELLFQYGNIDWLYQGREAYGYITLRSIGVKAACLLALLVFVRDAQDTLVYGLILCLGVGGNHIINVLCARRQLRLSFRQLHPGRHLKPILTLFVSTAAASLYSKADITMLGWLSSAESVGYYGNAHKLITAVLTLVTAVSAVFFPRLSYLYTHDREQYRQALSTGLQAVLVLALPAWAGLLLTAEDLVTVLFGSAFLPAAPVLRWFAVFTLVKGGGDLLCYQAILSSGKEGKLLASRVAGGLANVALNALLIPRYAHTGAAIASVISELVVNGMLLPHSPAVEKPLIRARFLLSLGVSTLAMSAAVRLVQRRLEAGLWSLTASVLTGVVVYGLVLVLTKNEILKMLPIGKERTP